MGMFATDYVYKLGHERKLLDNEIPFDDESSTPWVRSRHHDGAADGHAPERPAPDRAFVHAGARRIRGQAPAPKAIASPLAAAKATYLGRLARRRRRANR
jgi:hypothetical protein